jgi:hypothetical protein
MANSTLTASIIAAEALKILENNLVMAGLVHRDYEAEYTKNINGYKVGDTITIRRPADFTVRDGATASVQDVQEGSTTLVVDKQKGIDFKFNSADLALEINDFSDRIIKPAMIQLANQVDLDLMSLYKYVPNYVGAPSQAVNSFADFAVAPQRGDEIGIPQDGRKAILCPADHWALVGSSTSLSNTGAEGSAYRRGSLGMIGGVETYMSQNIPTHTPGTGSTGTDAVDDLTHESVTWSTVKDTGTDVLHIDGATNNGTFKAGDVFTISDVYEVNPVTKAPLSFLKCFTVMEDTTFSGTEGDLTISPPLILSGAHKNAHLSTGTVEDNTVTWLNLGTASRQNLMFHRNAFALAMVPMPKPDGAMNVTRKSFKGLSARLIPYYDGTNDISNWRFDILYGVKAIDPRLAVRFNGTS